MVVSTYQAASGAGAAAMEELELQTREVFSCQLVLSSFQLILYWEAPLYCYCYYYYLLKN